MRIELTEWERIVLSRIAATHAATYLGYAMQGMKFSESEAQDMERWVALSEKVKNDKG